MINSKEQIIEYFKSGIKQTKDFKIGIEHEKFLFENIGNKRIEYSKIKEMFDILELQIIHHIKNIKIIVSFLLI